MSRLNQILTAIQKDLWITEDMMLCDLERKMSKGVFAYQENILDPISIGHKYVEQTERYMRVYDRDGDYIGITVRGDKRFSDSGQVLIEE